ncbi:MAG TPA: peptidase S10 [Ramlibacter sp.]|nr:peptidase S10 [Ramlibacter sp.]
MGLANLRFLAAATAAAAALSIASCGGGGGGGTPAPAPAPAPSSQDSPLDDPQGYSVAAGAALPQSVAEAEAVTHHSITLPTGAIAYTAHAGHVTARDPANGAAQASFFYVAYKLDGANSATRPVTFFYNGGPGSATVWLHLGSFGPKRLVTGDPSTTAPTPFPLVDNMETLLDTSDLVFVDAIGTGYSQAITPNTNQTFWSVDRDAASFRDFVVRWLAVNGRNASPKYLFGESYGTTRTPVVAHLLETAGVHLDGIILQSSVLNYSANCDGQSDTVSCAGFLPSYGQTGAYYHLAPSALADSAANAQQMRSFTSASYDPAVVVWFSQHTPPDAALANQLQSLTGLPAVQWTARVNMEPFTYRTHLIPGVMVGRYDARVSAPMSSVLGQGDPSSNFITAQFNQAIGPYLQQGLGYHNASPYVTGSNAANVWDFRHDGHSLPDVIPDLAATLALRPQLKVLSLSGYHDLATPFFQTDRDLARLGPLPNVVLRYYDGGHMTYLDDTSRVKQKQDLKAFYSGAAQ